MNPPRDNLPRADFVEARKVSLVTIETDDIHKKSTDTTTDFQDEVEVFEELSKDYVPTSNLLHVRSVAFSVQEEEEKIPGSKQKEEPKQNVNERLYAASIEGREASERMKADALLDKKC